MSLSGSSVHRPSSPAAGTRSPEACDCPPPQSRNRVGRRERRGNGTVDLAAEPGDKLALCFSASLAENLRRLEVREIVEKALVSFKRIDTLLKVGHLISEI